MTRSDSSENWHDRILDYVLGNLSPDEVVALQEQIANNSDLARELAELQELWSALPYALPEESPSPDLKASVLKKAVEGSNPQVAHLQTTDVLHAQPPSSPKSRSRHRFRWYGLTGAIAATLVLALGIDNYRLRQQISETAQIQQTLQQTLQQKQAQLERLQARLQTMTPVVSSLREPNATVYALQGIGFAEGATGRLVAVPGHHDMVLVSEDLPVLSDDQIYRLWAIASEAERPQYCGQFRTNSVGTGHWTAPALDCSNTPAQLVITLDQPNDSIDSAGPLVMESQT
ncbi:MAG: anti-sigma factor domain-containing protein [Elainellaceae cyanobacterium]